MPLPRIVTRIRTFLMTCCRPQKRANCNDAPVENKENIRYQQEMRLRYRTFIEVLSVVCLHCGGTLCYKNEDNILNVKFDTKTRFWCSKCLRLRESDVFADLVSKRRYWVKSVKCSACKNTNHYLQALNTIIPSFREEDGKTSYWCKPCCRFREADSINLRELTNFFHSSDQDAIF